MRIFAERLKELRLEKKLSQSQLSKLLNIGNSSISRWENDQATINSDQLIILAKFFNVTTDWLLGLE
ncbi:MAG: helix-turn-helix transcriptional regulator [Clostridia bacterium]|nr:helix-turn-helix transcriptional regulator [Clostridia bacterium]